MELEFTTSFLVFIASESDHFAHVSVTRSALSYLWQDQHMILHFLYDIHNFAFAHISRLR